MADKYNGWTNYETWNVKLWLDNDAGAVQYWAELAAEHFHGADGENAADSAELAKYSLRTHLEEEIKGNAPELTGTYADLLGAALSEVNWYEIASHIVDDAIELEEAS